MKLPALFRAQEEEGGGETSQVCSGCDFYCAEEIFRCLIPSLPRSLR